MRSVFLAILGLACLLIMAPRARAQVRPYIGFAYPAGGQQGTTFQIRLGGQNVDDVDEVSVSGAGVSARVVEVRRRLNPQEMQLLNEQLRRLRPPKSRAAAKPAAAAAPMMLAQAESDKAAGMSPATADLVAKIEQRIAEYVNRPACAAISSLVIVEVTIAPDARPGAREITVATPRGVSNALVFDIGQLPEVCRKPMLTASFQVLGKEKLSLRKRPDDEVEQRITVPSTLNGQIANGEVNRYRFAARKGQKLVMAARARQLVPFLADAVPGWFQPVMTLYDASGKEVAYDDDYRFKPDPVILYQVPKDGEYVLAITDAIYRGREDFVYRISIGELPFITSIFPLGVRAGDVPETQVQGWNLENASLSLPPSDAGPGVYCVTATAKGLVSNCVTFQVGSLPECREQEPNNDIAHAQKVKLPIVINGRIDRPDDWDVFQFTGQAGQMIVADVEARRLDSPLDSFLKITDASGNVLAFNDDHLDPEAGTNTHDADSYISFKLPATGTYYVHLGDAARHGGEEYAYRLRISGPRPDFALRIVPSSLAVRGKSPLAVPVQVLRKDGFNAPIQLTLKDPPPGFTAAPMTIGPAQAAGRLVVKIDRSGDSTPATLCIEGRAKLQNRALAHIAVPAEDRMQAFLWRHFVPAQDLRVIVFDPNYQPPLKRVLPEIPATTAPAAAPATAAASPAKPAFSKQQVVSRLRQLKLLYEDGLLTDDFYREKVQECEAAQ